METKNNFQPKYKIITERDGQRWISSPNNGGELALAHDEVCETLKLLQALKELLEETMIEMAGAKVEPSLSVRGLRALDEVKHCLYAMLPSMRENDEAMRKIPPNEWTESQVALAEKASKFVNS